MLLGAFEDGQRYTRFIQKGETCKHTREEKEKREGELGKSGKNQKKKRKAERRRMGERIEEGALFYTLSTVIRTIFHFFLFWVESACIQRVISCLSG